MTGDGQGTGGRAQPSRRRALRFIAAGSAATLAGLLGRPPAALAVVDAEAIRWRGRALGAEAEIILHHPDRARAEAALAAVIAQIRRLEAIFSLFRPDSALSRLNRGGRLDPAPADLLDLLTLCREVHAASAGAFDPTVQPLWELYAAHFARRDADPSGPSAAALAKVRARIGMEKLRTCGGRIAFAVPGMAVTCNGVAQGYITDRAYASLARAGLAHALVDLGEYRALGNRPTGSPWRVGIADPVAPWRLIERITLEAGTAVATSAGAGSPFDAAMRHHHIFDPHSGRSGRAWQSVSVLAPTAALADALSTAIAAAPASRASDILAAFPGARAILYDRSGRLVRVSGGGARGQAPSPRAG